MMDKGFVAYLEQFLSEERTETFKEVLSKRTRHFTLVLEDLFQKHNVSAVIRSADVFGVQDLHIIENEYNNFISRRVAKGAQKWMTFYPYSKVGEDNTKNCIKHLKSQGYKIVVTSPHLEASDLRDFPINEKAAIVLGAEKNGVSDQMMQAADAYLKIPMVGFTESLNVSVAAALIMENLTHRLRSSDQAWALSQVEKDELYLKWLKKSIKSIKEIEHNYKEGLNS